MNASTRLTADDLLQHTVAIRRLVRHIVRDETAVDDVVQSTWTRALERPPRHAQQLGAWLKTIARHLALNTVRANRRRLMREETVARQVPMDDTHEVASALEGHHLLLEAIRCLPARQRATVVRHYFHGSKPREIAADEGVSVQAINARLRRARTTLRSRLDGGTPEGRWRWVALLMPHPKHPSSAQGAALTGGVSPMIGGTLMGWKAATLATTIAIVLFASGWVLRPILDPPEAAPPQQIPLVADTPKAPKLSGAHDPNETPPRKRTNGADPAVPARTQDSLLTRMQQAAWPQASGEIAREIVGLPGAQALASLRKIYDLVTDPRKRAQLLAAFRGPPLHPDFLRAAALGVTDVSPKNQQSALRMIEHLAMTRFDGDKARYQQWLQANSDQDVADVIEVGARSFVRSLRGLDDAALIRRLSQVHPKLVLDAQAKDPVDRRAVLRKEGMLELLVRAIQSDERSGALRRNAMAWLTSVQPPAAFINEHFRTIVSDPGAYGPEVALPAYEIIAKSDLHDALDLLLTALEITPRRSDWMAIATAIASMNQARAIPHLIGMLGAVSDTASQKTIAWAGLRPLTGVTFNPDHDAAWWRTWWRENKTRFDEVAQRTPIPTLAPRGR